MKRLRFRILLLFSWLLLVFGSQLILSPLGMHPIIYVYIGIAVVLILAISGLHHSHVSVVSVGSGVIYLGLKAIIGELVDGSQAVYTITEVSFVVVSTILAHWVSQAVREFESTVAIFTFGNNLNYTDFNRGHEILYREVRRARNYQRPLGLLTIQVDDKSLLPALNKILQEAQSTLTKQLVLSRVSKLLCEKLADSDVVIQDQGRFIVALPETTPDNLPFLINRIEKQVFDQVGIRIKVGAASLPLDGFTLEGLIQKATENTNNEHSETVSIDTQAQKIKQIKN